MSTLDSGTFQTSRDVRSTVDIGVQRTSRCNAKSVVRDPQLTCRQQLQASAFSQHCKENIDLFRQNRGCVLSN
jgi:hypothetical protein